MSTAQAYTPRRRWPLDEVQAIASQLVSLLEPYSQRIVVAGSIRRRRPDVGDIEILVIPGPYGVFDFGLAKLMRDGALFAGPGSLTILEKRPDRLGRTVYGKWNKLLRHLPTGIPVDVFTATSSNWGMALLVRTGPADFNRRVFTRFLSLGMRGHAYGGVTGRDGQETPCPDEETVFRLLEWPSVSPESRS